MRRGSRIARKIDREYRASNRHQALINFKKEYCNNCLNKATNLCNLTQTIDGKYKCIEYEKEEKR